MKISTIVDYLAPVAFLAALLITRDFKTATWVLVGASAIAIVIGLIAEKRVAPIPMFSFVLAVIFGGLTILFDDPRFLKMKMTIVDVALAAALFAGLALKKNPLKAMMGEALVLPDFAWRTLTIRYAVFFIACAAVNEAIWRTQSDEVWAVWRVVAIGAALVFSFAQAPYLMKHMQQPSEVKAPDPPDGGF